MRNRPIRTLLLSLIIFVLAGCEKKGAEPTKSWEIAVQGLYSAAISKDGNLAAAGSIHHGGSLWNTGSHERLFNWNHAKGEYTGIVATAFSPEGDYAVTAAHRTLVLWRTKTGEPIWFWTAPGNVLSIALTPNGDYALLGLDDHSAVIFDIKNGGVKRTFQHQGKVRAVSLSDDARLALTGSDDFTAKLWDLQSGKLLQTWQHDNQLVEVALSSTGKYAFTAGQADRALIWDASTGEQVQEMPIKKGSYIAGAAYTAAEFSNDEGRLLTGTNSQLVQLWDIKSGNEVKRWQVTKKDKWKPTAATVISVGFGSQAGHYYAIASNGLGHQLK